MKEIDTSIQLSLSIDEANQVLHALGNQPFAQVFDLVQKVQQQASVQAKDSTEIQFTFSLEETNGILNALGTQPYIMVYTLIQKIQEQGQKKPKEEV